MAVSANSCLSAGLTYVIIVFKCCCVIVIFFKCSNKCFCDEVCNRAKSSRHFVPHIRSFSQGAGTPHFFSFNRRTIRDLTRHNGKIDMQEQLQVVCTIKLWYQFLTLTAYMGVPQTCLELFTNRHIR